MSFCLAGLYCIVQRNIFFRTPMCKRTSAYKVVALEDGQVPSASGFSVPAMSLLQRLFCLPEDIVQNQIYYSLGFLSALHSYSLLVMLR